MENDKTISRDEFFYLLGKRNCGRDIFKMYEKWTTKELSKYQADVIWVNRKLATLVEQFEDNEN